MSVFKLTTPKFDEHSIIINCDCYYPEHGLRMTYFDDDDDYGLIIEVHLTTYKNFFKRIWVALRYVFGYRCRYGEWDEVIVQPESAQEIAQFLTKYADSKGDCERTEQ